MSQRYSNVMFVLFFLLLLFFTTSYSYTQDLAFRVDKESTLELKDQGALSLEIGLLIEKDLSAEHRHRYRLHVDGKKFVKFIVIQNDIYVQSKIYDQANQMLYEQWRYVRGDGSTHTRFVFEKSGEYQLEIGPRNEPTNPGIGVQRKPGKYQLRVEEFRDATPDDLELQRAEEGQNITRIIAGRYLAADVSERQLMTARREYEQGIQAGEAALAVYQRLFHLRPPRDRADAGNLALALTTLYSWRDYYADQERYEQLWEIVAHNREEMFGVNNPHSAIAYYYLANRMDPVRGERWIKKALAAAEGTFGPRSPMATMMLSDWAKKLADYGNMAGASETFEQAVSAEKSLSGTREELGDLYVHFINYGGFLLKQGKLAEADRYLQRAYELIGDQGSVRLPLGDQHGRIGYLFQLLGELYQARKDFTQAEFYFKQQLKLHEATLVTANICEASRYLANMYVAQGDYTNAEAVFKQANHLMALANHSPAMGLLLRSWARLKLLTGKPAEAVKLQQQAFEITEMELQRVLRHGSDSEKLKIMTVANLETNEIFSLQAQHSPNSEPALHLALNALLLRKGRVQDEIGQTLEAYRMTSDDDRDAMFDQLMDKQDLLARLSLFSQTEKGKEGNRIVMKLAQEVEELQIKVSERSKQIQTSIPAISLEAIQAALPENTALVEYVHFTELAETSLKTPKEKYLAYLITSDGHRDWVDLGEAQKIESLAKRLLVSIQENQKSMTEFRRMARQLEVLVMQPVRTKLGNIRQIFIAPDGDLNLIPFAALRDERGRYLIQNYLISYLTSGRDLMRLKIKHQSQSEGQIFAISDFNRTAEQQVATTLGASPAQIVRDSRSGVLSSDSTMATITFRPLEFAREEGAAIQKLFPQSKLYADGQATETLLKQVRRPYFLHLATHGFFLPNDGANKENALLRSGLAFAGANKRQSGKDDGILTAFEAAALDLWGTKLVVLSACETGNGEVKNGEGVFGLRRALVLAGAETQVSSLWKADDLVTRKLMEKFYGNLDKGIGRAEALQKAQLEILRGGGSPAPYYWANFICIGEWKPLENK